ncbi:MAG TPA: MBL fold metallo-hydrolase [Flavobacteriaceae bacterium]|nr:MBL fold metallo-hydrolase [Flavobacteriaceae bacterium]
MNKIEVTFLGTGTSQGIPVIGSNHPVCLSKDHKDKRLRTSAMIEWENKRYIIDCGPDFRQQMLANKVERIDGILYTHEHTDHMIGMDDIRPFYFEQGNIPIYAEPRVLDALAHRFDYIFDTALKYPGIPSVEVHPISDQPFFLGNQKVIPIRIYHGRLPIYGFRFGDFTYITDGKTIPKEEFEKIKGTRVLVLNALRREPHLTHFNLEEALELVEKINPQKAYFTHISHLLGFHEEVEKQLPKNVHLAFDNLKLTI